MKDAYWESKAIEYVSPFPPMESSLFDDRERLSRSWQRASEMQRAISTLTPEQLKEVIAHAKELLHKGKLRLDDE